MRRRITPGSHAPAASAPWSSNTLTTEDAFRRAAACSGVTPFAVAAPTSAPPSASTAHAVGPQPRVYGGPAPSSTRATTGQSRAAA